MGKTKSQVQYMFYEKNNLLKYNLIPSLNKNDITNKIKVFQSTSIVKYMEKYTTVFNLFNSPPNRRRLMKVPEV